jgi:hypothetical protein
VQLGDGEAGRERYMRGERERWRLERALCGWEIGSWEIEGINGFDLSLVG